MSEKHKEPLSNPRGALLSAKREEESEPKHIVDTCSEVVIPYLIHFSKRGIVPKILSVEDTFILHMVEAQGPRLNSFLQNGSLEELSSIYSQLGTNTAYMAKFGVGHCDLHTNNVVIEGNKPIIIDWDKANLGFPTYHDLLLSCTKDSLKVYERSTMFAVLENAFNKSFYAEINKPIDASAREIHMSALEEFGFV